MILKVLRTSFCRQHLPNVLARSVNHFHLTKFLSINVYQQKRNYSIEAAELNDIEFKIPSLKDSLYPFSKDKTIQRMKDSKSYEEILPYLQKAPSFTKKRLCQLIISMYDHFRLIQNEPVPPDLQKLMTRLDEFVGELTLDEISLCLHYLVRLGVSNRHPTMERLSDLMMAEIKRDGKCSLVHLSHYSSVLSSEKGLYNSFLSVECLPQILKQLEDCSNIHDLSLLTHCLTHTVNVLSLKTLGVYTRKVEQFLDEDILNETTPKEILKIVNFLNIPHWSNRNSLLIRRLLLELQENIPMMDTRNLVTINRCYRSQLESAKLVPLLVKRAQELLKESPDIELLNLAVLNVTPEQRVKIAKMISTHLSDYQITGVQSSETLQTVFKIMRLLKISDIELCNSYWTKVLNNIHGTAEKDFTFIVTKSIQKYMFFNNNLGGTYRHRAFESSLSQMLMHELKKTLIPKDFADFASFIIAYGDKTHAEDLPEFIVDKIEELNEQFTIKQCVQLSRGIQIMSEIRFRKPYPRKLEHQIDSINFSLAKTTERLMKNKDLHLSELNDLFKGFITRKASKSSSLFHDIFNCYNTKLNLNSRQIRDISFYLVACNYRMDSVCDQFVSYILDNWEHINGDTVEKILSCCYNFSYFPEKLEVFDRSSEIIIRDFNFMSGLSIVQALLALIFFKACPQQLIAMVFSNEFMKRIEQEIAMCYSKNTYPQRVMNQVMQLNRAVCLDCPEVNVRWFQQSFLEAQASKPQNVNSLMYRDVQKTLLSIVNKPEYLVSGRVTPYGYRIDFELSVDQYNRFVVPAEDFHNVNFMPSANKIAVLLLSNKMLCDNDFSRLKGSELLRMRHLEMMGYKVIHIKISEFTSIYSKVTSKIKYLKNLLQLSA